MKPHKTRLLSQDEAQVEAQVEVQDEAQDVGDNMDGKMPQTYCYYCNDCDDDWITDIKETICTQCLGNNITELEE